MKDSAKRFKKKLVFKMAISGFISTQIGTALLLIVDGLLRLYEKPLALIYSEVCIIL